VTPASSASRTSRSAVPLPARFDCASKQFVSEGLTDGAFHPTITRTFPLEQIADAHRFMEAGEQVGKIVVTL
jgi:NADPH:quinone reductase-like Zn-dependent oxidoreductase